MTDKTIAFKALRQAQQEFKPVLFDKINPFHKSKYATLHSIKDSIEPALHKHGFVIMQPLEALENGDIKLYTNLLHESGELISLGSCIIKGGRKDQEIGASITYQRRYLISSALFLFAEDDDDGESDSGRRTEPQPLPKKAETSAPPPVKPPASKEGKPDVATLSTAMIQQLNPYFSEDMDAIEMVSQKWGCHWTKLPVDKFTIVLERLKERKKQREEEGE